MDKNISISLNRYSSVIALFFVVLIGLFIQYPYMSEFPSFIHAWSQSDRYSLAIGFINNGFDLFHPETLIYNKQFPNWWTYAHENTITSVDFPIMEYVVAIIMKITGNTSPWIFRICTFTVAMLGMLYLFKLTLLITDDSLKSLLVTAVAMTSPVYAYYFNGFIPGIPALTFAIIALYFYLKYLCNDGNIRYFTLSLLFITLSILTRTSFAVIWVAMLGFEFLRILRKETKLLDKLIPVIISIVVFFSYYLWNRHLASENGTLFLGDLMPADDWNEFWAIMTKTKDNWQYHYFRKVHYQLFVIVALSALCFSIWKKIKLGKRIESDENNKPLSLWIFLVVIFFGYLLFTFAMAKQFPNHDYYFIDTYFLPVLLLLIMLLNVLPKINNYKYGIVFLSLSAIFVSVMLKDINETQKLRRRNYWGAASERTIRNYRDSEKFLDSVGVSKDSKILTLWAYPQNTPFILMNRKGFTVMKYDKDLVDTAMTFDYDYVIVENEVYKKEKDAWKYVFEELDYHSDNGKITLFVKKE